MVFNETCNIDITGFDTLMEVKKLFESAKKIVVIAHCNADGDAIGSVLGCYHVLKNHVSAEIIPILPTGNPVDMEWMPGSEVIINANDNPQMCEDALSMSDVVLGTDFNNLLRIDPLHDSLRKSKAKKVLIDHHHQPEVDAFDYVVSDPSISSACELCYWSLRQMFGRDCFNSAAAKCLYTGMRTDTGNMSFSNTQPNLYLATAALVQCGFDVVQTNRFINNNFTVERMRYYAHVIGENMEYFAKQQVAIIVISLDDMQQHGITSRDITGLVNEVMRIRSVNVGVLIREEEERVRLSLRSKEEVDVNLLARSLFENGGGHTRAAGATSYLSLAETIKKVKEALGV